MTRIVVVPAARSGGGFACGERLRQPAHAELAELVALARHDRRVAVAVDQARHHEPAAEIERLHPRGVGRSRPARRS